MAMDPGENLTNARDPSHGPSWPVVDVAESITMRLEEGRCVQDRTITKQCNPLSSFHAFLMRRYILSNRQGGNAQRCAFQEWARQRQPAQSITLKRWSHLPLFSRVRCPSSSALLFTFRVASTRIVLALPAAARRHRMIFPAMICESLLTGALLSAAVRTFVWPLFGGRGGMNSAGTGTSSPSSS